jgi:predicted DNA repair protein MutK
MSIQHFRRLHRVIAPIAVLPLLVTVSTGVIYRIAKSWFGLSRNQIHFLMSIHEGEYLGHTLEPIYVLLNGIGLLWMLATGGAILVHELKQPRWVRSLATQSSNIFKFARQCVIQRGKTD